MEPRRTSCTPTTPSFEYTLLSEEVQQPQPSSSSSLLSFNFTATTRQQQQQQQAAASSTLPYMTTKETTSATVVTSTTTTKQTNSEIPTTTTTNTTTPGSAATPVVTPPDSCTTDGCSAFVLPFTTSNLFSTNTPTPTTTAPILTSATTTTAITTTQSIPQQLDLESMGQGSIYEMKVSDYQTILQLPGNRVCVDCGGDGDDNAASATNTTATPKMTSTNPDWGSPNLGILFCFTCSGIHRSLGTHISFVRSVRMDRWDDLKQIPLMMRGGNTRCNTFLRQYNVTTHLVSSSIDNNNNNSRNDYDEQLRNMIRKKYDNPVAQYYQQLLKAERDQLPIPPIPETVTNYNPSAAAAAATTTTDGLTTSIRTTPLKQQAMKKKMEGFGSPSNYNQTNNTNNNNSSSSSSSNMIRVTTLIVVVIIVIVGIVAASLFIR